MATLMRSCGRRSLNAKPPRAIMSNEGMLTRPIDFDVKHAF